MIVMGVKALRRPRDGGTKRLLKWNISHLIFF